MTTNAMLQLKTILLGLFILPFLVTSQLHASDEISVDTVDLELRVFLEGAYDPVDHLMNSTLNKIGYLPGQTPKTLFGAATGSGQPYGSSPWAYYGTEGRSDRSIEEFYPETTIDWILVSLRSGIEKSTELLRTAAVLLKDGDVVMIEPTPIDTAITECYIVVEHRNHMIVMTPQPVPVVNGRLTYDFTQSDSYVALLGNGQKEMSDGSFAMFIGNIEHDELGINDINFNDIIRFIEYNGEHSSYYEADVDFNGDVNVADQRKILDNVGVFTEVPQ
jgi:hypothetical protein